MTIQYGINVDTRIVDFTSKDKDVGNLREAIINSLYGFPKLNEALTFDDILELYMIGKKFFFPNEKGIIFLTRDEMNIITRRMSETHNVATMGMVYDCFQVAIRIHNEASSKG
jgi:hypothetical protein